MKKFEVPIAYTVVATAYVTAEDYETAKSLLADGDWEDTHSETAAPGFVLAGEVKEVG